MALRRGSWFGLPEFGVTEAIQRIIAPKKPLTQQGGSNLWGRPQATPPTVYKPPTNTGGGGGGGGGTGGQSSAGITNTSTQPTYDFAASVDAQKAAEEGRYDEFVEQAKGAISAEYDPIFAELDRRAGLLPGQKAEYEKQIGDLATSQKAGVKSEQESNIAKLGASQEKEKAQAQESFKSLEQDIRSQLLAKQFYFGGVGAGDSSAPGQASEAVTRGGLKARGTILKARDQALSDLELKKADVNNLATEQGRKVDEWKSSKLFETTQFFTNKLDELQAQKTNASVEKARAIDQLIQGTGQQFLQRLSQLDDQVSQYKSSIATWQMQRAAELEDFQKKLAIQSQYTSTSGGSAQGALDKFVKIYGTGAFDVGQAANLSGADLTGLQLTPESLSRRKSPLEDQILGAVQSQLNQ